MEHPGKNTPRDFFLYLFATVALYVSAVNVIALAWQYVNYFFPEPLSGRYYSGFSEPMRFAMATLIILFPAYVWVMRFVNRDIDRHPDKRELWIRRWLIYLTLFIASGVIIGDLVSLVYTFLGGDLAIRFFLKALSVLVVVGAIFWYYLFNLRRKPGEAKQARNTLAVASVVVVALLVIGAFFIVGSPATNRQRAADQKRVNDLQSIQGQLVYYWQQKGKLPARLDELNDPLVGFSVPVDPVTNEAYEYEAQGTLSFDLCATFALKSEGSGATAGSTIITKPVPIGGEFETPQYWAHDAGGVCFTRTIDPDRFPRAPSFKSNRRSSGGD